jgi:hypothetical protein
MEGSRSQRSNETRTDSETVISANLNASTTFQRRTLSLLHRHQARQDHHASIVPSLDSAFHRARPRRLPPVRVRGRGHDARAARRPRSCHRAQVRQEEGHRDARADRAQEALLVREDCQGHQVRRQRQAWRVQEGVQGVLHAPGGPLPEGRLEGPAHGQHLRQRQAALRQQREVQGEDGPDPPEGAAAMERQPQGVYTASRSTTRSRRSASSRR